MKLLVFGRSGQLACELARRLPEGVRAEFLGRDQADLTDPAACAAQILARSPDAVINAAAWTAVDAAEAHEQAARLVNAAAPTAMAQACAQRGLPFVHLSSDYVFPGTGTQPFLPTDRPDPLGAYGRSKYLGEQGVLAAGGQAAILRTSWVFSAHGSNFVKTMLRLGRSLPEVRVVADQIGGPTPAADLADAALRVALRLRQGAQGGIYHFAGQPDCSWADFATAIFARAGLACAVARIPSADYPTPAPRPLNSRLECRSFEAAFDLRRPDWRRGLDLVVKELDR